MFLNLKFQPVPSGTDALYVYEPGLLDAFYLRPDWKDANYVTLAAIVHLGKLASKQKAATGGKERVVVKCNLLDFIFEPLPNATLGGLEDLPPDGDKIIPFPPPAEVRLKLKPLSGTNSGGKFNRA